jgi:hypothetical protein
MWEYILVTESNENKLAQLLNERGKENWEAVNFQGLPGSMGKVHFFVMMKREKQ